jgi:hypothetical protein
MQFSPIGEIIRWVAEESALCTRVSVDVDF